MTKNRYPDTELKADAMENIARTIRQGPPEMDWRFE